MKISLLLFLVVSASSLFAGITSASPAADPVPDFNSLLSDVDGASLFEGLPHRLFEREALALEKRTKKVFSVADEFFYETPLELTDSDEADLRHVFRFDEVCAPYTGYKLCGGFHADYMVRWMKKEELVLSVLVCFGCGEALILIKDKSVHTDLTDEGYKALDAILRKYRRERPNRGSSALKPPSFDLPPPKVELAL